MKLRWLIQGEHCLTVETGAGRVLPGIEWRGTALRRVSAGWNRAPERHTIEHWLLGALPENGSFEAFVRRAQTEFAQREIEVGQGSVHDWVWANADWEYPGAITFEREEDQGKQSEADEHVGVEEAEVGEKLREAADEANRARRLRLRTGRGSKSALSGAQGKIAAHIDENDRMSLPQGRASSTWIIKVESRHDEWPGEAGVESVCERALDYLGIEAANTFARIIDGIPVVMSQRSDRALKDGRVVAVHQEDWLQAYGKSSGWKYDMGGRDSGYASLYAILRRYAEDPERETRQLTRVLAATCAMANGDLHRKNLGLLHSEASERFHVRLAPVYDFSSQCGVPRTGDELQIRIGGMKRAWEVDEARWRLLAGQCRIDEETVLKTVRETAACAPAAIAAAREECRDNDEYRDPKAVERRTDAVIRAAERYARVMGVIPGGKPQVRASARKKKEGADIAD